jgi:hypothetical protein
MKPSTAVAVINLLVLPWTFAQNVIQEPQEDPVQEAIREFNQRDKGKSNEVTVVLDPSDDSPVKSSEETPSEEPANPPETKETAKETPTDPEEPVLVTGKPPEGTELQDEVAEEQATQPEEALIESEKQPHKGLSVRVEKIQSGTGTIDPSKVKLLAPFPAKPLSAAPAGWKLEASDNAPPFTREVELSPGKKITLKVRPHLLIPEADGANVFNVLEPGFDPALGYQQDITAGAILSNSIRQLEADSTNLGAAIENLQQLLVSLPKPEVEPAEPVVPATNSKR